MNSGSEEISLERAKELYQISRGNERLNGKKRNRAEAPDWGRSKKLRFKKGQKALVIPIFEMPESAMLITMGAVANRSKLTLMDLITPVQLVVYKDEEGKEIVERMYSKADQAYRIRKNNHTEDKDFTGIRWFEDENGNFKRGFIYENGEVVKTLYPNVPTARTMCQTYVNTVTIDYFSIACGGGSCGDPIYMYTTSYSYTYQDCQQKHDNDYVLVGGTGGAPWGGQPDEYSAEENLGVPEDRVYEFLYWLAGLNQKESEWVKANPLKAPAAWFNQMQANKLSRAHYMCKDNNGNWIMDIDGTNQNAFKHAYWSAMNRRSFGEEVAQTIGDNHEGDVTSTNIDVVMDLYNNQLGRKVAETCGCDGTALRGEVLHAIWNGLGKRHVVGTSGVSTNQLSSTSSATTFCND